MTDMTIALNRERGHAWPHADQAQQGRQTQLLDEPCRRRLLRRPAAMPDGDRLCHGDLHARNSRSATAQPIVIDWPEAARGDPAADVCRSWLLLKLHGGDPADPYVDACCRTSGTPRETVLGWLPYIAAARLAGHVEREADSLPKLAGPS